MRTYGAVPAYLGGGSTTTLKCSIEAPLRTEFRGPQIVCEGNLGNTHAIDFVDICYNCQYFISKVNELEQTL